MQLQQKKILPVKAQKSLKKPINKSTNLKNQNIELRFPPQLKWERQQSSAGGLKKKNKTSTIPEDVGPVRNAWDEMDKKLI